MSTVEKVSLKNVEIPKAKKKSKKQLKVESSDSSDDDKAQKPRNIVEAARKVAESIDGVDQKQTEMELLSKLLGFPTKKESDGKANLR